MDDIAPALYRKIMNEFNASVKKDAWIMSFQKKLANGSATQKEADHYSELLGRYAAAALSDGLSPENLPDGKIYWNIAKRTVEPMLRRVTDMVNAAMEKILSAEHKKIRLGTKPVRAPFNQDRCDAIMNKIVALSLGEENGGTESEDQ